MDIRTRDFRKSFRQKYQTTSAKGVLHIVGVLLVASTGIIYPITQIEDLQFSELWIVVATFLYANLIEYFMHRYPMHHRYKWVGIVFDRHTLEHHQFFTEEDSSMETFEDVGAVLFPFSLIFFFIGLIAYPSALIVDHIFGGNSGYIFFATAVAYYFNYEILHFLYHAWEGSLFKKLLFLRLLSRAHLDHHDKGLMARYNFNVTYPVSDWLFGTYFSKDASIQRAKKKPLA